MAERDVRGKREGWADLEEAVAGDAVEELPLEGPHLEPVLHRLHRSHRSRNKPARTTEQRLDYT